MHQRQDLDEMIDRFQVWFDDKQRYMASDSTIPLKTNEIGRVQKKISVRRKFSIFSASKIFFFVFRIFSTNWNRNDWRWTRFLNWTNKSNKVTIAKEIRISILTSTVRWEKNSTKGKNWKIFFFDFEDLNQKLNQLEKNILNRQQQLNGATEQRQLSDRLHSKLQDWIRTIEQQIKDPVTTDLQQPTHILKEKYRQIQVRLDTKQKRKIFFFYVEPILF